jgi:hypothetical protein
MIEEAIKLIEKELDMYQILDNNISDNIRTKTVQKAKNSYKKKVKLLNYILEILNKQKK